LGDQDSWVREEFAEIRRDIDRRHAENQTVTQNLADEQKAIANDVHELKGQIRPYIEQGGLFSQLSGKLDRVIEQLGDIKIGQARAKGVGAVLLKIFEVLIGPAIVGLFLWMHK
jgi:hypothetical protein